MIDIVNNIDIDIDNQYGLSTYISNTPTGRAHITGPIVSTSARGGLGRSILKTIHHPVKAVPTGWDAVKKQI